MPGAELLRRDSINLGIRRDRRSAVKHVAVDRRLPGFILHFQPCPRDVYDKQVACQVDRRLVRFFIVAGGIQLHDLRRSVVQPRAQLLRESMRGRPFFSVSPSVGIADPAGGRPKKAPLSPIARRNNPLASGEAIRALTESDPADSPAMVTFSGSPPKAAIFCFTQRKPAIWSIRP